MSCFTGGRGPCEMLSTFCVVGIGGTKSKTEPQCPQAYTSVGGLELAGAGPLWLSGAHCVPFFPDDQCHHIGSLKSTMVRVFIPWKLAKAPY